jgi:tRNA pseudouridine55 synthase
LSAGPQGLLLLDKPGGPTSHDLVMAVRRATGQRRVGHSGTLDPMASGLLPLVLGGATRLVRFLPHEPKLYVGSLELGRTSDSDDVTGEILTRHEGPLPGAREVLAAAEELEGTSLQMPPAISARKVGGERLYKRARRGLATEAKPKEVRVPRFRLRRTEDAAVWRFEAEVSAGTYIRALARDLGSRLGCGGLLASLRRTRIGPMSVETALAVGPDGTLDATAVRASLISPESMPLVPPPLRLADPEDAERLAHGRTIRAEPGGQPDGLFRVLTPAGRLLGIVESHEDQVRPKLILPP